MRRHKILTDYLDTGWIRPSYSQTAARLFFFTKQNGSLRSVVDYRELNEVVETQYVSPPEWSNIVNQLGDANLFSTFDCADFFFQNRLRDEDSWMTAFSTCFGQFEFAHRDWPPVPLWPNDSSVASCNHCLASTLI